MAYLLGWANMPLIVAVLTTLAAAPFGIILIMFGWHVFTAWTRCFYDRGKGLLTIRSFSSLGPLGQVLTPPTPWMTAERGPSEWPSISV